MCAVGLWCNATMKSADRPRVHERVRGESIREWKHTLQRVPLAKRIGDWQVQYWATLRNLVVDLQPIPTKAESDVFPNDSTMAIGSGLVLTNMCTVHLHSSFSRADIRSDNAIRFYSRSQAICLSYSKASWSANHRWRRVSPALYKEGVQNEAFWFS